MKIQSNPNQIKLLELFCGSKSISKEAEKAGILTFTTDINKRFKPDYIVNIFKFDINKVPFHPDIIWASPPCTCFSVASAWMHWHKSGEPKTIFAEQALKIIQITLDIFNKLKPTYWFLENPRGLLRKQSIMDGLVRHTVSYCKYGDDKCKPTDIWTNNPYWQPKPACKPFSPAHSINSTNKLNTPSQRSVIPTELCSEIIACNKNNILPSASPVRI